MREIGPAIPPDDIATAEYEEFLKAPPAHQPRADIENDCVD